MWFEHGNSFDISLHPLWMDEECQAGLERILKCFSTFQFSLTAARVENSL